MQWGHSSQFSCPPGEHCTTQRHDWWPSLCHDVHNLISASPVCTQSNDFHSPSSGLLQPLPIPFCTVVDRFSKAAHFIPLLKLPSAIETSSLMIQHVYRLHGIPTDIVSDLSPQFAPTPVSQHRRTLESGPPLTWPIQHQGELHMPEMPA